MADRPAPRHTTRRGEPSEAQRLALPSWRWAEHPDRGRLGPPRAHRHEQPVEFGDKERGARSRCRRHSGDAAITSRVHLEYIDHPFTAAHIDAAPSGIDKHIIGI